MKMNEPSGWPHNELDGAATFMKLLSDGHAVEVTQLPKWMAGCKVAIDNDIHDRFVAWGTDALRRHNLALDECARLEHMLDACGCAAYGAGGCFICKAVDARGYSIRPDRHVLTMTNFGKPTEPVWLIHG